MKRDMDAVRSILALLEACDGQPDFRPLMTDTFTVRRPGVTPVSSNRPWSSVLTEVSVSWSRTDTSAIGEPSARSSTTPRMVAEPAGAVCPSTGPALASAPANTITIPAKRRQQAVDISSPDRAALM